MRHSLTAAAVLFGATVISTSSFAADLPPAGEPAPVPAVEEEGPSAFDIAFGIAATTDYISRGITNSGSDPAIQGYVEPGYGMFYVNVWTSNVDYGPGFKGAEIDVAAGIRPEWGPVTFDLGYVHYFYAPEDTSPDYGEIFAKAEYAVNDMLTLGSDVFFAPDYSQTGDTATYVEGSAEIALPYDFSLSGGLGYQFFEDPDAAEQLAWNVGLSYSWKALTFDLRYWDTDLSADECVGRSGFSNGCDARVVATISVDTAWSELRELGKER